MMWPLLGSLVLCCRGRRGRYVEGLRELFEVLELVGVVECRALRSAVVHPLSRGRLLVALVGAGRVMPAW